MHAANGDDGVDGRPGLVTELLPRCMPHTKCHYERRFFSSHSPKTLDEVCHYGITHTRGKRGRGRHAHNVAITSLWSKKFAYSIIQFKVFKSNFKHHNEVALYRVLFPVPVPPPPFHWLTLDAGGNFELCFNKCGTGVAQLSSARLVLLLALACCTYAPLNHEMQSNLRSSNGKYCLRHPPATSTSPPSTLHFKEGGRKGDAVELSVRVSLPARADSLPPQCTTQF